MPRLINGTPCLTGRETSARLSICRSTLKTMRESGQIGHVQIGSRALYPEPEVEAYVDRNSHAAATGGDLTPHR